MSNPAVGFSSRWFGSLESIVVAATDFSGYVLLDFADGRISLAEPPLGLSLVKYNQEQEYASLEHADSRSRLENATLG
jgi:hypothetical protein